MAEQLVFAHNVSKHFPLRRSLKDRWRRTATPYVRAVHNVTLSLREGETVGLVGETGCGKSTLGRLLLRLDEPTSGRIDFSGKEITHLVEKELRFYRSKMQIIFQDPYSSLNPRHTVEYILSFPLRLHFDITPRERRNRISHLLNRVGLQQDFIRRYPHQFSGGQRQRIGIARALAVEPQFIVADEPVAALDVSIQAQILNLLRELQHELSLTVLLISHDLAVVTYLCDRIAVMYLGAIVEGGVTRELIESPMHPYTKCLLSAVPEVSSQRPALLSLGGEVPSGLNPPAGCPFHPRCPEALIDACKESEPELRVIDGERQVACHLAG